MDEFLKFAQAANVLLVPAIAYIVHMGNRISVIETHLQHLLPKKDK